MSVASRNPFSILGDEAEAPVVEKVAKEEPPKDKSEAPQQAARGGQRGRGGASARGGRYYPRGGGAKTQTREGGPETDEAAPPRDERRHDDSGRGRGRGGRGRGDRGRGAPGGRGRPFDKHSQTGRTDTTKQVQQGWGSDEGKAELKAEEEGSKDAASETPAPNNEWAEAATGDEWGAATAAAPGGEAPAPAPAGAATSERRRQEEEPDNTLTLEEYLKQQKEKASGLIPTLDDEVVRKANEGEDVFEGSVRHEKDEEDSYFTGKTKAAPKQRSKSEKVKETISFEGRFADDARAFRGRGRGGDRNGDARGEYRGRGNRGGGFRGGRGGRGRTGGEANGNGNVDVANEEHFPSLGGK